MDRTLDIARYRTPVLIGGGFGVFAVIVLFVGANLGGIEDYGFLTREPQSALQGEFYAGAFSNLGAITWAVPAVACLFAATLCGPDRRGMMLLAGGFSLALLLDDLFLLHDDVYPLLGIHELVVQAVYAVTGVATIWLHRERLGLAGMAAVTLSLGLWAGSLLLDYLDYGHRLRVLLEDGSKYVGIAIWAAVWTMLAYESVRLARPRVEDPQHPA